jgi:hypothetical protein
VVIVLESEGQVRVGVWCDGGGTDRVAIKCGVGEVVGIGRESEFVFRSCVGVVDAVSAVELREDEGKVCVCGW